jgi:hypothetical protein
MRDPVITKLALCKCADPHKMLQAKWSWLFTARTCSNNTEIERCVVMLTKSACVWFVKWGLVYSIPTDSGAHPASYLLDAVAFAWGWWGCVDVTPLVCVVLRVILHKGIPPAPRMFLWCSAWLSTMTLIWLDVALLAVGKMWWLMSKKGPWLVSELRNL